jgi:DNA (cytosine-5)-methyltransferase 1
MQYPQPNGSYIIYRLGEEVDTDFIDVQTIISEHMARHGNYIEGAPFTISADYLRQHIKLKPIVKLSVTCNKKEVIRFVDLFAGIGGIRCGLEQAIRDRGMEPVCVFTSEIKPYAVRVLHDNHPAETITGDITKVATKDIPDFNILNGAIIHITKLNLLFIAGFIAEPIATTASIDHPIFE